MNAVHGPPASKPNAAQRTIMQQGGGHRSLLMLRALHPGTPCCTGLPSIQPAASSLNACSPS